MSGDRVERRLAAILAADVAGYSRLMEADEEDTLARVKAHRRELIDPKISEHRGRIVKTTGDGLLVEFASVVDAVRCAVEMQGKMIARNAATPAERRIEFRMGINVGDIIIEDGDIFGDGVNIAARLEALAEPGGICLSATAHEQVRDRAKHNHWHKLTYREGGLNAVEAAASWAEKFVADFAGYQVANLPWPKEMS
jgi:adenylate cyclase